MEILFNCPECKKDFYLSFNQKRTHHIYKKHFCSKECLKKSMLGKNNPFYGKKHTEEIKKFLHEKRFKTGFSYSTGYLRSGKTRILQHRYLMEKHLGYKLPEGKVVHHINGIRNDNRIENLMVMSKGEHQSLHNKLRKLTG
jgi:hypothetical protein